MKLISLSCLRALAFALSCVAFPLSWSAPATLLFEDDFNRAIPGWTAIQPPGNYFDGPMRWQYEIVSQAFVENSNIYTDSATFSPSGTAVMLINDATTTLPYTFRARMIIGDNDGFGLVFGYKDPTNVFRVTFSNQTNPIRVGYPWRGWSVDQKTNNVTVPLFGGGTPGYDTASPVWEPVANRPFDLTISVSSDNRLTMVVVDDPAGAAIEYRLVENQLLPAPADGKVGLLQWGQSGGTPRAFQIKNPTLEPTPLIGNPNAITNVWTPELTLRANGTTWTGAPRWYLPVGVNGPFGVLVEDSDISTGNDAAGQIDFPAPALVAGDPAWTNIFVKTRMVPVDDDGFGLLLRYQNPSNFYRISIRGQTNATGGLTTAGTGTGLSVQKTVNGQFEEIFFEETPQYLFGTLAGAWPFEMSLALVDQSLQILVRGNLNTTPTNFVYGPIDMGASGTNLNAGKIGIFSWAMNRLEVDSVKVYGIDGVPIDVTSPYGTAIPATGLNSYPAGTAVQASVPASVDDGPGRRRRAAGWAGSGSVPATGTGNSVSFTLNAISSISWNWVTEYNLSVAATGPGGTVSGPADVWQLAGSPVAITATPNAGYVFTGWSGSSVSTTPNLNINMAQPITLTAHFKADTDNDGLPDEWETANLGGLTQNGSGDPDSDGKSNNAEFQLGTNPNFAETVVQTNAFYSRWENVQRDPALPGVLVVRDFGGGYRGFWENSNDNRDALINPFIGANTNAYVSFEGPRIIIRTNVWNPAWTDYTASTIFSVADNDGSCVYFRYQNEENWYRVTLLHDPAVAPGRPKVGISIQKRFQSAFTEMGTGFFLPDPFDNTNPSSAGGYKRFKITVVAAGSHFEVKVTGWDVLLDPPAFNPASEVVVSFDDVDLPTGRFGVGAWGQSGLTGGAVNGIPVDAGMLTEDVVIEVGGNKVFEETWDAVPLAAELPAGWADSASAGTWNQSAHGSIIQLSGFAPTTSSSDTTPKADADSANLIGPSVAASRYLLEMGFHPFDSDGIGFIYDYVDANNYGRVLFVSAASADGRIPQGLNVSKKSNGIWTDIVAGDLAFVYTPGQPFTVQFAKNAQEYRLNARNVDNAVGATWAWPAASGPANPAFGLASWGEVDAHYDYLRVSSLDAAVVNEIKVVSTTLNAGVLVITFSNRAGGEVTFETSPDLSPNSWTTANPSVGPGTAGFIVNPSTARAFFRIKKSAGVQ